VPLPVAAQAESASKCGGIVEKACVENKTTCIDGHTPANRLRLAAFATCDDISAAARTQDRGQLVFHTRPCNGVKYNYAGRSASGSCWHHDKDNDKVAVDATLTLDNAPVLIDGLERVSAFVQPGSRINVVRFAGSADTFARNHNHSGGFVALETGGGVIMRYACVARPTGVHSASIADSSSSRAGAPSFLRNGSERHLLL